MAWERIGVGRTAEIFAIDTQRAWKVFRPEMDTDEAAHEARMAQAITAANVPVPAFLGLLSADGKSGLLYERIHGPSLDVWVNGKPTRLPRAARILAETHAQVHRGQPRDLPKLHDVLARRIQRATPAPESLRAAALARLATLPHGETLCHGDFHWGNILLGKAGPMVIDWENAAIGDPMFDIARTLLLYQMGFLHEQHALQQRLVRSMIGYITRSYLRHYRRMQPVDMARLAAWRLPVAVARLSEGIDAENPHLLRLAARLAHEA
jgi:uncharacterized protein (TIGR02172 family)